MPQLPVANPLRSPIVELGAALATLSSRSREVGGEPVAQASAAAASCSSGRRVLEGLGLAARHWYVPEAFEDGNALWSAVRHHELEGLVAKRLDESYRPGERGWVKVKNATTGGASSSGRARFGTASVCQFWLRLKLPLEWAFAQSPQTTGRAGSSATRTPFCGMPRDCRRPSPSLPPQAGVKLRRFESPTPPLDLEGGRR
jgi:hypothetical protein